MGPVSFLKKDQWNGSSGFTLIELMAAMVVMAIGLFAVIQLQLVSIRGISYAEERIGAQEIANGVVGEILTEALQWVNTKPGDNVTFASVFSAPNPSIVVNMSPIVTGNPIPFASLQPLTTYRGHIIGPGEKINTAGCSPSSSGDAACKNLGGAGQLYQVYYYAEVLPITAGAPVETVRGLIYVTWDNKDHGANYDWSTIDSTTFWNRNMVSVPFTVPRGQNY